MIRDAHIVTTCYNLPIFQMANELKSNGVYVVRDTLFKDNKYRQEILEAAKSFPEFKHGVKKYILGGHAALGNASAFHCPEVRTFRQWAMGIVIDEVFKDLILTLSGTGWELEQLIGRLTIREPGQAASVMVGIESIHKYLSTPKTRYLAVELTSTRSHNTLHVLLGLIRRTAEGT